ncbi:hypothetical protein EVAR_38182_1 [Eumeta japonica]|uniref:Uncharacterized protein n=1 Tax=Eumeta variegata TaxID=151549 RepID=A0A4C1WGZ2_EUMVA|nr:hypothetical protein EVAR_38182_1 [Eumeta japonica]
MAGTSDKYFTMQGSGNPVSASGQGEKAGPQASSSSDCSSSLLSHRKQLLMMKPKLSGSLHRKVLITCTCHDGTHAVNPGTLPDGSVAHRHPEEVPWLQVQAIMQ